MAADFDVHVRRGFVQAVSVSLRQLAMGSVSVENVQAPGPALSTAGPLLIGAERMGGRYVGNEEVVDEGQREFEGSSEPPASDELAIRHHSRHHVISPPHWTPHMSRICVVVLAHPLQPPSLDATPLSRMCVRQKFKPRRRS